MDVNNFVQIDITPIVIKTQDGLRGMSPQKRNCCFEDECPLKFFRIYSKNNCLMECYTKIMYKMCNCSSFELPRIKGQNVCTVQDLWCIAETIDIKLEIEKHCQCLDDCNSFRYNVKTANTELSITNQEQSIKSRILRKRRIVLGQLFAQSLSLETIPDDFWFSNETMLDVWLNSTDIIPKFNFMSFNSSYLEIQFELPEFLAMHRISTYSFVDFVSQIGGVFGLFMGISILSFVEIVYFCTVRLFRPVKEQLFEV